MPSVSRRQFCASLGSLAAITSVRQSWAVPAKRFTALPNIVYVLADDLGWGDIGAYNPRSAIPTPNANRLATEGRRFTDMHSSSAVCSPSRYSILTGRYCWRSSLKEGVLNGYSADLIEPSRMTIARMLKDAGYYTAAVGKWHLGLGGDHVEAKPQYNVNARRTEPKVNYAFPLTPGPRENGFDYYFGIPASLDMPPYVWVENDHVVEAATGEVKESTAPRGVVWAEGAIAPHFVMNQALPIITDKAVSVIKERATSKDQPFFLYLPFPSPHQPWLPLPEYQGKSHAGTYGDYVVEVDAMLGRVMHALDEAGIAENTLLILTSDNGAQWNQDDMAKFEHRANGDWRGRKADIWEGGHRIPFIARWPKHIPAGTVSNQLAGLQDFMATAAAAINIPLPPESAEDSFNLLPAMIGDPKAPIRDSIIFHSNHAMFGIQQGDWKLELGLGSGGFSDPKTVPPQAGGPQGQLYNLADDPAEIHNVWLEHPDIVQKLTAMLEIYKTQGHTRPGWTR